jgi:hypothetical protein
MSRETRIYANGVTLYWDTDNGEMGIDATKRDVAETRRPNIVSDDQPE